MDHNQILLDAVIEFPSQLLGENSDGQQQEGSLLLSQANQLPISNQNMVEMGKKLLEAASENNLESVRSLMTGGAPFTGNWLGTTPLHAAAKAGHIETVELLLKAGIFRDAKTKVDRTALQMAAEEGYTTIVQMLLEHGADINSKDMLRMTALHWAVERGHRDVVTVLLSYGADVLVFNKFDKTAMDIACDNGFQDIALQLEAAMLQRNNKTHSPIVNGRTEAVRQINSSHETSSVKSPTWKTSPEEDALEKLTANTLNSESTSHEALKLLESHGISFLPVDNSTLLTSALESGQSISLTEAGKMALNHLKKDSHPVAQPEKVTSVAKKPKLSSTPGHPRVVTITAEQFMAIAGRLQSRGNGTGKPVIFSLPKNFSLSAEKISNTKLAAPLVAATIAASKAPISQLDSSATGSITNNDMQNSLTTESAAEAKSSQLHLSMPILTEDEPCSEPTSIEVKSTNGQYQEDHVPAPSGFDFVSSQEVSMPSLDISSPSIAMIETNNNPSAMHNLASTNNTPTVNSGTDDMKLHFFKSGQLKGSARTTPMTILCQRKRRKSVTLEEAEEEEDCQINTVALASMHSRSAQTQGQQHHQPTLNNAAPPLDADDDMFVNEESESCHGNNNPPVWLSIMEEENSQFSAGAADNDDDLLDPSRLAAQLASIRQAASQYSFSS